MIHCAVSFVFVFDRIGANRFRFQWDRFRSRSDPGRRAFRRRGGMRNLRLRREFTDKTRSPFEIKNNSGRRRQLKHFDRNGRPKVDREGPRIFFDDREKLYPSHERTLAKLVDDFFRVHRKFRRSEYRNENSPLGGIDRGLIVRSFFGVDVDDDPFESAVRRATNILDDSRSNFPVSS